MKIRSLMTWVLGPILLSLPMMCMHAGDDHHDGGHHFSIYQPAVESPVHDDESSRSTEQGGIIIRQGHGGEKSTDVSGAL